ncbi:MAG: STAS domain-containing protein [Dehalococcoidia bacterium]|nr:STAS domain-containing protein [Dehalococcoidia bacterium]
MPEGMALKRENLGADLVAGLTTALVGLPQGMGYALIAGINPIYGLYTAIFATIIGAFTTGSRFMNVAFSSALAVAVFSALDPVPEEDVLPSLFVLTLLVGIFQLIFGLLKLAKLTRWISHPVMTGFIAGLALLIILGQLGDLTGYYSDAPNKIWQAWDLLFHLGQVHPATLAIGAMSILVVIVLQKTRLKKISLILGLIIPTIFIALVDWAGVQLIGDISTVPGGLPSPIIPDLKYAPGLVVPALALAILALVQSVGISQNIPEPDGKTADINKDFRGQGIANTLSSFLQCTPSGGSLSGTALNVSAGARTRWSNIFAGTIIGVVVVFFASQIEVIPLAAIAALLIIIGIGLFKVKEIVFVWKYAAIGRWAMVGTFAATMLMPLTYAIFIGVLLSIAVQFMSTSRQVNIFELVPLGDGKFEEKPVPKDMPSNKPTALNVYGDVYFATVDLLEQSLPSYEGTRNAVLILGLRGQKDMGTTFMEMLEGLARKLKSSQSLLMLSGIDPAIKRVLEDSGTADIIGPDNIFTATPILGDALSRAIEAAERWIHRLDADEGQPPGTD